LWLQALIPTPFFTKILFEHNSSFSILFKICHLLRSLAMGLKDFSVLLKFITIQSAFSIRHMTRIMKIRFEPFDLNLFLPKIPQM
jgi:hypothetical protein